MLASSWRQRRLFPSWPATPCRCICIWRSSQPHPEPIYFSMALLMTSIRSSRNAGIIQTQFLPRSPNSRNPSRINISRLQQLSSPPVELFHACKWETNSEGVRWRTSLEMSALGPCHTRTRLSIPCESRETWICFNTCRRILRRIRSWCLARITDCCWYITICTCTFRGNIPKCTLVIEILGKGD